MNKRPTFEHIIPLPVFTGCIAPGERFAEIALPAIPGVTVTNDRPETDPHCAISAPTAQRLHGAPAKARGDADIDRLARMISQARADATPDVVEAWK